MQNENTNQNNQASEEQNKKRKPSIRTLRADTSEYIKSKKLSLVDLAAMQHQTDKGGGLPVKKEPLLSRLAGNRNVIALITLIVAVAAVGVYILLTFKKAEQVAPVVHAPPPLLNNQDEVAIDITGGKNLNMEIKKAFAEQYNPGDLVYMPIKRQLGENIIYLKTGDFLNSLKTKAPAAITSFLEENFFLGILNLEKKHSVLIFEIEQAYEQTVFGGMLNWEKNMPTDIDFMLQKSTVSPVPVFKDKIIKNNHVRLLQTDGKTVLLYTFLNSQFLIITDNEKALEEIIERFVVFKFS